MKDIVKDMWEGILNEKKPEPAETKKFEVKYTNKEDEEYMEAWTKANDEKHNQPKEEETEEESWKKCKAAFEACGYTGDAVTKYMDSRKDHDPMEDDPNRDRDPK